jgi:hypothetical protein
MVKLPVPVAVLLGTAPGTGAVTFIAAAVIWIGVWVDAVVTVKLFVVAVWLPNITVTGLPWCVVSDNIVPFTGLVVIPSAGKPANATSL